MLKTNRHYNQSIFDKVLREIFYLVHVCISYNYKSTFATHSNTLGGSQAVDKGSRWCGSTRAWAGWALRTLGRPDRGKPHGPRTGTHPSVVSPWWGQQCGPDDVHATTALTRLSRWQEGPSQLWAHPATATLRTKV